MASKRYKKLPEKTKDLSAESIEKLLPELKKNCTTKFDESLDLSFQINNKQKKSEVNIRTVVNLPGGTGKKVKVAVVCEDNKAQDAKDAGADIVGGDEFVVMVEKVNAERDVSHLASEMIKELAKSIPLFNQVVSVSASIGIAIYPEDATTPSELLKHADIAMYHAKELGSNNFQYFTEHMNARAQAKLRLENAVKQARVHPDPHTWNWIDMDKILLMSEKNNLAVRLHGPVSPQSSHWAKNDNRTPGELEKNMNEYFTEQCKRYNGHPNVLWMDVVNETVERNGEWFGPKKGVDQWENPWTIIGFENDPNKTPPLKQKSDMTKAVLRLTVPLAIGRSFFLGCDWSRS